MDITNWASLNVVHVFALATALGFSSGIRLYALLFCIGLSGYMHWIELPSGMLVLSHPIVIGVSGVLMVVEFLADKIPAVDSVWDSVHTFVRLPVAAVLAGSLGESLGADLGVDSTVTTTILALLGGGVAATSHFAKTSSRMAINTSPEPFTNWGASLFEDVLNASLLWAIFTHPILAGCVALVLLLLCVCLIYYLWRFVRRLFRKLKPS